MNIRHAPEYIPFMEALITLVDLFPRDLMLYGIMMTFFQVPESLQLHINVTHGTGTRLSRDNKDHGEVDIRESLF